MSDRYIKPGALDNPEHQRLAAIAAYQAGDLSRLIAIHTSADLTPTGKRRALIVRTSRTGHRQAPTIRLYIGARTYRDLPLTAENQTLAVRWLAAQ